MISYEKYMFFIPNRLYIEDTEIYVSFNVAMIPVDNQVNSASLCIPLPERSSPCRLLIRKITSSWDEQWIKDWKPEYLTEAAENVEVETEAREGVFPVTHLMDDWRFRSLDNHGLYISIITEDRMDLMEEKPPYLIIATD